MSELPDLTGLAVESAERTTPPAFEMLVRRAGIRRRRQAVGVVVATAVVAVGAGVLLVPHGGSSSAPPIHRATTSPTGSPAVTPRQRLAALDAAQIVARGSLYTYAENDTGAVLTTWQVCVDAQRFCRYAWRLDTGTRVVRGVAPTYGAFGLSAYATGHLFVLATGGDADGDVVDRSGRVTTYRWGQRGVPAAGDVVAPYGRAKGGGEMVIDPRTRLEWPLPFSPGDTIHQDAIVSSDGSVWVLQGPGSSPGTTKVLWKRGGFNVWYLGAWHEHTLSTERSAVPGTLAVSRGHVAALSSFDGATQLPVGTLAVSTDAGQSWTDLHRADVPFDEVDSMAATSGGELFVADAEGGLWRSTDASWTTYEQVTGAPKVYQLEPAGSGVIAEVAVKAPRLALIDAQGHATTVPAR